MGESDWLAAASITTSRSTARCVALAGNGRMSDTYEQMLAQTLLLLRTAGSSQRHGCAADMPPAIHRELHRGPAGRRRRRARSRPSTATTGTPRIACSPGLDPAPAERRRLTQRCGFSDTLSTVDDRLATIRERPWTRVELVAMDPQCDDITIALYRQDTPDGAIGIVHTYSSAPGAAGAGALRRRLRCAPSASSPPAATDPAAVAFACGSLARRDRAPRCSWRP